MACFRGAVDFTHLLWNYIQNCVLGILCWFCLEKRIHK